MAMHHTQNILPTSPRDGVGGSASHPMLASPASSVHAVTPAASSVVSPSYLHQHIQPTPGAAGDLPAPPLAAVPNGTAVPSQEPNQHHLNGRRAASATADMMFTSALESQQQQGEENGAEYPPRKRRHTGSHGGIAAAAASAVAAGPQHHALAPAPAAAATLQHPPQASPAAAAAAFPFAAQTPMSMSMSIGQQQPNFHQQQRPRAHTDDELSGFGFHHRRAWGSAAANFGGGFPRPQSFGSALAPGGTHAFAASSSAAAAGSQQGQQNEAMDDHTMLYHSARSGDLFTTVVASAEGFHQGGGKKRGAGGGGGGPTSHPPPPAPQGPGQGGC